MVSVAFVLFRLIADNESGQGRRARGARAQELGDEHLPPTSRRRASSRRAVGGRPARSRTALRDRRRRAPRAARANELLAELGVDADPHRRTGSGALVDVGRVDAIAPAHARARRRRAARASAACRCSDRSAPVLRAAVKRVTGLDAVVRARAAATLAEHAPGAPAASSCPTIGERQVGGEDYRVASFAAPGFGGERVTSVSLLARRPALQSRRQPQPARSRAASSPASSSWPSPSPCSCRARCSAQIGALPQAARRLGRGDFSRAGADATATTSSRRSARSSTRWRASSRSAWRSCARSALRLENAMRRLGEAFASNLDREALLEIVVRTAVDGVDADGGRARARRRRREAARAGRPGREPRGGSSAPPRREALDDGRAARGRGRRPAARWRTRCAATSGRRTSPASSRSWRAGSRSPTRERELFHYLAAQAAVSIENVGLHETVQRQAVTDELTGLFNRRRFQEALTDRGRARPALRARPRPRDARHRRLQAGQRHLRPPAGRPRPRRGRPGAARVLARDRRAGPLRRRGARRRAARAPTSRAPTTWPSACARASRRSSSRSTAAGPLRVTASFGAAALPESADDQRRSSRRPTRRSTRPSARARTAPSAPSRNAPGRRQ